MITRHTGARKRPTGGTFYAQGVMMTLLQLSRIVAYSLNRMTREMGLANLAIQWNGDDMDQILAGSAEHILILDNKRLVGEASIKEEAETLVTLSIPDCHDLIRAEHLDKFDPGEYGIKHLTGRNPITRDKYIDLLVEDWVLDKPIIDMGPREIPIKQTKRGRLKVVSYSGKVSYC